MHGLDCSCARPCAYRQVLASSPDTIDTLHGLVKQSGGQWAPVKQMPPLSTSGRGHAASVPKQLRTHLRRNLRIITREPAMARARVGSHLVVGLLMGGIYYNLGGNTNLQNAIADRIALSLFSMIFLMLSSTLPTVLTLLPELTVIRKEVRNNWYGVPAYYAAKLLAEAPLLILPPLLYLSTAGMMSGLSDSESGWRFGYLYVACFCVTLVAHSWATVLSCAAPTLPIAIFLAPSSIMPMILFAGFFKNVASIPWALRWISYVDYMRYCWEMLGIAAFYDLSLAPPYSGAQVLEQRLRFSSPNTAGFWRAFGIVIGFVLLFRVISLFVLKRRISK